MQKKILRYKKQNANARPIQHAVDNFVATLSPLGLDTASKYFPSIVPDDFTSLKSLLEKLSLTSNLNLELNTGRLIACIPGVGKLRPHRAWPKERWIELIGKILSDKNNIVILVGGEEETDLCGEISQAIKNNALDFRRCLNFAGRLSLAETAALLKNCQLAISGDTGPAHIAVAVGTKVIGLTGPTFAERSGPYGMSEYGLNASAMCQCHDQKKCLFITELGSGECMQKISVEMAYDQLVSII
jgi:ADP-heptose:LPS heptosyltransferase